MTPAMMIAQRATRPPVALRLANGQLHTADSILAAWSEGKAPDTIRAYHGDLERFAAFLGLSLGVGPLSTGAALDLYFRQSAPSAHEIAAGFRASLLRASLSAATINRHLAALRSIAKLARMLGVCGWLIEVPGVRGERRRQSAGPTMGTVNAMLAATAGDTTRETRDAAIVWVFVCLGLRVNELCGLTLQETDLARKTTWIRGKGRREREQVPLPAPAVAAIRRYLVHRGLGPGPLFRTLGRRGGARDGGLEPRSVLRLIGQLGGRVGQRVWCHGLRHTSITQAVELGQREGLGIEKIRAHSRHRSITTLMTYVDEHDRSMTQRVLGDLVASVMRG